MTIWSYGNDQMKSERVWSVQLHFQRQRWFTIIDNVHFEEMVDRIHPAGLQLKG